jgi:bifunctional DNA-binding transcriptional regulator/antitoxin component of YhaV-PrlF toxin-antitoxin module
MTIADSIWLATALLHRENPAAADFSVQEIIQKTLATRRESYRAALPVFTSKHCVANKVPNPLRYRILVETTRGRRRLFREGDPVHPDRHDGKIRPEKDDLPLEYQALVEWYDEVYAKAQSMPSQPVAKAVISHRFPMDSGSNDTSSSHVGVMSAETVFVGPDGTVVLPQLLRQELDLKPGACLRIYREQDRIVLFPVTDDFIRKMRGSLQGYNLLEDREREHRIEKER